TIRPNRASANPDRSAILPRTVSIARPSRSATPRSRTSCSGLLSKTIIFAPAAARIGPCWPPPPARQSTSSPTRGGNQSPGTGLGPHSARSSDRSVREWHELHAIELLRLVVPESLAELHLDTVDPFEHQGLLEPAHTTWDTRTGADHDLSDYRLLSDLRDFKAS